MIHLLETMYAILESFEVYTFLTIFMVVCGSFIARESPYSVEYGRQIVSKPFLSLPSVLLFLSFAVVFGCRWGVGVDHLDYLYKYVFGGSDSFEILFGLVETFMREWGFHFAFYFGFWALWDIVLLFYCVKDHKYIFPLLALMLMLTSTYLSMMNTVRQQAAMAVFLLSLHYIDNKKLIKYLVCCLIAVLLHKSAIIMLLLYPILSIRNDWFKSIWIQLLLYAVCFYLQFHFETVAEWIEKPFTFFSESFDYEEYYLDMLFSDYWSRDKFGRNTGWGPIINIIRVLPIILYSKTLKSYFDFPLFKLIYTLWFVGELLALLFGSSIILNRVVMYFTHIKPIMYSFFLYYCFRSRKNQNTLLGVAMILLYMALFINIVTNPLSTAQFSFFWEHTL